jgi:hypothetical protein
MIEESIYALLAAQESPVSAWNTLIGTRIYPTVGDHDPALPYIVYQRVSTQDENTTCGYAGLTNYRFQFDVYSDLSSECHTAMSLLHTLLTENLRGLRIFQSGGWEAETKLYRITADYSLWGRETAISHL